MLWGSLLRSSMTVGRKCLQDRLQAWRTRYGKERPGGSVPTTRPTRACQGCGHCLTLLSFKFNVQRSTLTTLALVILTGSDLDPPPLAHERSAEKCRAQSTGNCIFGRRLDTIGPWRLGHVLLHGVKVAPRTRHASDSEYFSLTPIFNADLT